MSVNLMDLVKGAVGSQMGPLAGILGENEQNTNSAINAAIPAILGGLMKKSSTPAGANEIFKTLDDHDGGILDNLGGMLGGGNHSGLLSTGTSLLGMLFGNNQSTLLGTIARMAGIGNSKAGTILGLLAPIVMGVLGKQRRSSNLDVGGLTSLLSSQKDHLKGSMPGELASSLGLGDLFGNVAGAGKAAANLAGDTGRAAAGAAGNAGRAAAGAVGDAGAAGGGLMKMLLPLIVIAGLAFAGYKMFGGGEVPTVPNVDLPDVNISTPDISMPDLSGISIPGFDPGAIGKSFGGLTEAIGGITDVESANAVLPKITEASGMFENIDLGAIASGPKKEAVGGMLGGLVKTLRGALDKAYAIPGVREVVEPVINQFLGKFAAFGL